MDIVDQIKGAVVGHEDAINQGIDVVGDAVDQATESKYAAQVDQAQDFLKDQVENISKQAQ